jgi:hypothetical protein
MIQGTTPTIYVAFSVEIESLREFKIIFEQEGKENLVKTQAECIIDTENNVAYTKLSQEETLAFSVDEIVRIQAKALTNDGNVIASSIVKEFFCPVLDDTLFEGASNEITPIDTDVISLDFENCCCGFGLDFGNMIVYQELPADTHLSSTSTNAVQNKVITENFARVDNEFIKTSKRADEIEAIALGAEKAVSYTNYSEMVRILNGLPRDYFAEGQGINIVAIEVPDLWVAYRSVDNIPYTYTTDKAIIDFISGNGLLQIGYFYLAQKETQKVDLTDYAKKDQVPVITATQKENGAYTLTITMGVE